MAVKSEKELLFKSIEEIGNMYRRKEVSPVEVLSATLARLSELEPKLNAFITVLEEEAIQQAKQAEKVFSRGDLAGKLSGIPISIKDIFYTKGLRTTVGSKILRNYVPEEDSYLYSALKSTGSIIFGKTNMLEFAYGSVHPEFGKCNNPWDTKRTAGGSSSGSASSIAAGIGFASIGTDTGGSIRLPSSFCGIVGLKPTYERVSRQGLFNLSHSLDHIGPLTRTVRDNAIVLEHISSVPINFDKVFTGSIKGLKVGMIRSLIDSPAIHPEVRKVMIQATKQLEELGAEVIDIDIPELSQVSKMAFPILLAEGAYHHKQWYPERAGDYAEGTRLVLEEGSKVPAVNYVEALQNRKSFMEKIDSLFDRFEVLLCPTSPSPATEEDPSFEDTTYDYLQRTIPFNLAGNPALTVSAGLTASQKLPVGIQFIGRTNDEATIYRAADTFQTATGGYKVPKI
jgi:aspartyl-tRNA(Asn)/glutamyl-tRNA(Gln) amidotransferase subunit A